MVSGSSIKTIQLNIQNHILYVGFGKVVSHGYVAAYSTLNGSLIAQSPVTPTTQPDSLLYIPSLDILLFVDTAALYSLTSNLSRYSLITTFAGSIVNMIYDDTAALLYYSLPSTPGISSISLTGTNLT